MPFQNPPILVRQGDQIGSYLLVLLRSVW